MRRVVVNSTPLIVLCNIDRLFILKELYGEIIMPQAVLDEIMVKEDSACNQILSAGDWIKVQSISREADKRMYQAKLHAGEVETMILAQEEPRADLVIIDDNSAKKTAMYLGLKVTGTLGVLLKAKKQGIIFEVKPIIEDMISNGFYIREDIKKLVLLQARESIS